MSTIELIDDPAEAGNAARPDRRRQASGRFLRRIWRTHFYAAVIAAPVLILFAITGLGILYTQPIQNVTLADKLIVPVGEEQVPYLDQLATAQAEFPELSLTQIVPPAAPDRASLFEFTDGDALYKQVFVDPYTGEVTGTMTTGDDIIGLANRLHGNLNNESVTVTLPNMAWVIDRDAERTIDIPLGDVVLEIATIWALVLSLTGLYLWWPRRSQRKPLLKVRWSKGGRLRWRDLHSTSGVLLSAILLLFILSGMTWSNYWGNAWYTAADKATPNAEFLEPISTPVSKGSLNRVGNRITWAEQGDLIPGSAVPTDGTAPAPINLETVIAIAQEEGMLPGYSIVTPFDDTEGDEPVYGTYQLSNPWPNKQQDSRTVYLDQFTGRTLAESTAEDWGMVQRVTDYTVELHMGTQLGIVTRILATLGCLAIIVSLVSSVVMWWKRRPRGSAGLPPRQQHRTNRGRAGLGVIALAIGLIFPLWGISLIAVIVIDVVVDAVMRRRRAPAPTTPTNGPTTTEAVA
jgi:uncharacterized iron-regulated membrane protein